jgi:hypothetical protein
MSAFVPTEVLYTRCANAINHGTVEPIEAAFFVG